ncbi:MAG: 4-hydroxy-tetrahydrodipicolinate reductase [Oscillospiraceae bacterium]|nr:4-hydroxy-tetrahydrodipicolinate reductase [Oscillospiraceae bacterium]
MNIIISGANGHMGRIITDTAAAAGHTVAARVSRSFTTDPAAGVYASPAEYTGPADMLIDFSHHAATGALMAYCTERGIPAVIATTGQTEEELAAIRAAAQTVPVFLAANMSIGVALLAEMAAKAAAVFPDADIEIIERHHNRKQDVPSGTALMLARRIQAAHDNAPILVGRHENGRRGREIGISSLRYGNEVGTHEIVIAAGSETFTLKHEAEDRSLFARGALTAAEYLAGKGPGLYGIQNIVE